MKNIEGQLVYIKMDGATRQMRSFLGINVQYYDKTKNKTVIKMLACADTEGKHTSQRMCDMLNETLQKFNIHKQDVLCLVEDTASTMTKTVEQMNEDEDEGDAGLSEPLDEDEHSHESNDESDNEIDECADSVQIHHKRCAVHTLQLAIQDGLKQPNCNKLLTKTRHIVAKLRSPNILSVLEKRQNKRPVLDMATRWGSTYKMIKRLTELREAIEELGVLSPELHISSTMWSGLEVLCSVLEMPYSVTLKLQAESLTCGDFIKEWCSLKRSLRKNETTTGKEILKSTEKRELILFQNNLFLAGVYVDSRYRILLSPEQLQNAKSGLTEVAMKHHRSLNSMASTASTSSASSTEDRIDISDSSTSSSEDEFEKEFDMLEQRAFLGNSSSNNHNTFDHVKLELNANIDKMLQRGRLKGENVWKIVESLDEPLRATTKILSAMPVTQVSVERLFLSMNFILSDKRSSTKQDLPEAILFLRANDDLL